MADHFRDATKKMDFISRDEFAEHLADIQLGEVPTGRTGENIDYQNGVYAGFDMAYVALKQFPAADVVARDCYDRILAENDTMRKQLAQIGKKPGNKMDDVRPVVRGKWIRGNERRTGPTKDSYICSVCGEKTLSGFCGNPAKTNFCPTCGADMSENKNGQRGEKNSG